MSTSTTSEPGALTLVTTTATTPVTTAPEALMASRLPVPGGPGPQPVPDHARLADGEVDEHAHRVQRDQQVGLAPEPDDQQMATPPSTRMPVVNASRSPRTPNWRGMKPSSARIAASRGNALNDVFAARIRMSVAKDRNRK